MINGFKGDGGYQDEKEKSMAGKGGKLGGNWLFKVLMGCTTDRTFNIQILLLTFTYTYLHMFL